MTASDTEWPLLFLVEQDTRLDDSSVKGVPSSRYFYTAVADLDTGWVLALAATLPASSADLCSGWTRPRHSYYYRHAARVLHFNANMELRLAVWSDYVVLVSRCRVARTTIPSLLEQGIRIVFIALDDEDSLPAPHPYLRIVRAKSSAQSRSFSAPLSAHVHASLVGLYAADGRHTYSGETVTASYNSTYSLRKAELSAIEISNADFLRAATIVLAQTRGKPPLQARTPQKSRLSADEVAEQCVKIADLIEAEKTLDRQLRLIEQDPHEMNKLPDAVARAIGRILGPNASSPGSLDTYSGLIDLLCTRYRRATTPMEVSLLAPSTHGSHEAVRINAATGEMTGTFPHDAESHSGDILFFAEMEYIEFLIANYAAFKLTPVLHNGVSSFELAQSCQTVAERIRTGVNPARAIASTLDAATLALRAPYRDYLMENVTTAVTLFSDAPFELARVGGLPLTLARDCTRLPLRPITANQQLILTGLYEGTLDVAAARATTLTIALDDSDPINGILNNFSEMCTRQAVPIKFVKTKNIDALIRTLEEHQPTTWAHIGHAGYISRADRVQLQFPGGVADWEALMASHMRFPSITFLMGCEAGSASALHGNLISALFASLGPRVVFAPLVPISVSAAVEFVTGFLMACEKCISPDTPQTVSRMARLVRMLQFVGNCQAWLDSPQNRSSSDRKTVERLIAYSQGGHSLREFEQMKGLNYLLATLLPESVMISCFGPANSVELSSAPGSPSALPDLGHRIG